MEFGLGESSFEAGFNLNVLKYILKYVKYLVSGKF